ncbi:MAG: CRISPR-associated endonuclease Cas1 [bacterium]|nr:CRISPR-associated endonuclease Cas1 [bacterium]
MSTLYITQQGALLGKTSERLKVTLQKELLTEIPLLKISQVVLLGRISVTPAALRELAKRGIDLCWLTQHGEYIARMQPEMSKNSLLRIAQYRAFFDEAQRLELARSFVLGKLANLRLLLLRRARTHPDVKQAVERIKTAEHSAKNAATLNVVRGHEGEGSAAYFSVFSHLIKAEEFSFTTRVRRPPTDPVNALLSFGYTLLMNDILSLINLVGFEPYIGYLHAEKYGRPALALDLMEEFRPLIVDAMVLTCLNKRVLTAAHFIQQHERASCRLSDEGRRTFLTQYEARRTTEITTPDTKQKMTYQHGFEHQVRLLAAALQEEAKTYTALRMP